MLANMRGQTANGFVFTSLYDIQHLLTKTEQKLGLFMTQLDKFVKIENKSCSIIFDCRGNLPAVLYMGSPLSSTTTPEMLANLGTRQEAKCAPVLEPPLSLMPSYGDGFTGSVGAELYGQADSFATNPQLVSIERSSNKVAFRCEDSHRHIAFEFAVSLDQDTSIATWQSKVINLSDAPLNVNRFAAPTLPLSQNLNQLTTFEGRWSSEFQTKSVPIVMGAYVRENRRGKTSHDSFPGVIAQNANTTEQSGECFGFHLGISGNHRLCIEQMADGRQFVQMNELLYPGEVTLAQGESYTSPVMYSGYSESGLSALSRQFHRYIRAHVLKHSAETKPRPIHYNTWEGLYFDHDMDTLKALANKVADLGIERFVLDDGWFGTRTSDRKGLGDWWVNKDVYPDGLGPLIEHVNNLGMEFGIWFEPEMVNPDSDLYRTHPDWVLGSEQNAQVPFRHQYVLDLTHPDVTDYLYRSVTELLDEHPQIKYIKWDMNRDVNHQINYQHKPAMHQQIQALYALIARIKQDYPYLEIESCCSGGGRVDLGILQTTDRFWTSDSNDALDRLNIQRGFSFFFPPEVMGAHIGPRDCHITGRHIPMAMRAAVAMFGHMGIEMDPRELTDEEVSTLKLAIELHKSHRQLIHSGDLYRLDPDGLNVNFGVVSQDKSEALFAYNSVVETVRTNPSRYIFTGLSPTVVYRIQRVWPDRIKEYSESVLSVIDGETFTGEALMQFGLQMPVLFPQSSLVFHLQAVTQ